MKRGAPNMPFGAFRQQGSRRPRARRAIVYERAEWTRENISPPMRTTQNSQYIAFRFTSCTSAPIRPPDAASDPAVRATLPLS